jgi:hypothetical protein
LIVNVSCLQAELEDVITAHQEFIDSDSIDLMKSELLSSVRGKYTTVILTEKGKL